MLQLAAKQGLQFLTFFFFDKQEATATCPVQLLPSDKRDWRKVPGKIPWVYSPLTKRMSSKRMGIPKDQKVCCSSAARSGQCVKYAAQEAQCFISSSVCYRESVSDWCSLAMHIGTHKCTLHDRCLYLNPLDCYAIICFGDEEKILFSY